MRKLIGYLREFETVNVFYKEFEENGDIDFTKSHVREMKGLHFAFLTSF